MARGLAGTNTQISGTTTVAKNLTNFSMAAWIRRATTSSIQSVGFFQTSANWLGIFHFSDNNCYIVNANGGSSNNGSVSANITGWNQFTFTFDGSQATNATKLRLYINGAAQTLSFFGNQPATTSNSADLETFRIGRRVASNFWSTGDFAEIGMWQATLSAQEAASLSKGFTCDKVRPQSLVYYSPLVRDIQDLARGMTLTDAGSTVQPHTRVYA
jgi:hypothetical protein